MNRDVRLFLAGVPGDLRATVTALRRIVLSAAPQASETLVWRSLSYHLPHVGGRVKGAVCLITPKADRVQLGFIHGALLLDPAGLLKGRGVSKRVVEIRPGTDVTDNQALIALVRAAVIVRPVATLERRGRTSGGRARGAAGAARQRRGSRP